MTIQSIVLQLQAECLDHSVHTTALLRKALVVATKLKLSDFNQWCDSELNGYRDAKSIPEYRRIHGEIKIHNPYRGWQPVIFQDSEMQQALSDRTLDQPISELEDVAKNHSTKSVLQMSFPPEVLHKYLGGKHLDLGLIPVLVVSPSELIGIMDSVRNTILQWTLRLEEQGILGEGLTFTQKEIVTASATPSIRIDNFQGILGNVSHSHVTQDLDMTVSKGDVESLSKFLTNHGVQKQDVKLLTTAIESDSAPKKKGVFGRKVSSWIAKMVEKAASGAWDVSVSAAGSLLASAIGKYYGF